MYQLELQPTIEDFELTNIAPKTIEDLMNQLEYFFALYIKERWLKWSLVEEIISKNWWIDEVIKKIFWNEFDWKSKTNLNSERLMFILIGRFWNFIKKIYDSCPELWDYYKQWFWTKEWVVWKIFFDNDYVDVNEISIIEEFFSDFLKNKWFKETKDFQARGHENEIYNQAYKFFQNIIEIVISINKEEEDKLWYNSLIQLLIIIIWKTREQKVEDIEQFIDSTSEIIENYSDKEYKNNLVPFLTEQVKKYFPEIYTKDLTFLQVETILLWEWKDSASYIVNKSSFYFNSSDEKNTWKNDIFPENWTKIPWIEEEIEGLKDIYIYNIYWKEVYYWDMTLRDMQNLSWTYYILSDYDAKINIPVFLKIHEKLSSDSNIYIFPNDSNIYIDTSYIKIHALWKIQDWNYIENVYEIEIE